MRFGVGPGRMTIAASDGGRGSAPDRMRPDGHKLNGKWRRIDGDWLATIKGQRLEAVLGQINGAKRVSLHKSVGTDASEAQVDSVTITELEIGE